MHTYKHKYTTLLLINYSEKVGWVGSFRYAVSALCLKS